MYILLHLFEGWFSFKFTSYHVYSWGGFGVERYPEGRRNRMCICIG